MGPIDFVLIVLIFGEFFLFLAVANYFERRGKKHKRTETKDSPFYEGLWTKSKIVYTICPDHLEIFVPTSRVEIQERQKSKNREQSSMRAEISHEEQMT